MIKFHYHLSTRTGQAQKHHVAGSALPCVTVGVTDRLFLQPCQPSVLVSLEIHRSLGQRRDLSKRSSGWRSRMSRGWLGRSVAASRTWWEMLRQLNIGQPEALWAAVSSPASQGDSCLQGTCVAQGASRPYSAVGYRSVGTNVAEFLAWSWEHAGWRAECKVNKNPMTEQYFKDRNYAKSICHVKEICSFPAPLHLFTCKDENTI